MAEILFSFDVCLAVHVCVQRTGQSDQFKVVKATDFKFDMRVPGRNWSWPGSRDLRIFGH